MGNSSEWRKKHPERWAEIQRKCHQKHKAEYYAISKAWRIRKHNECPWMRTYETIMRRLNGAKHGKKRELSYVGVEMKMTLDDLKTLWFRDKPWEMKFPTIDRIDSAGHYELNNCRYIEMSENRLRNRRWKE